MMHGKQHLSAESAMGYHGEPTGRTPPQPLLCSQPTSAVNQRKANASMLRWSLEFAAAEKERKAGNGVTLYLL